MTNTKMMPLMKYGVCVLLLVGMILYIIEEDNDFSRFLDEQHNHKCCGNRQPRQKLPDAREQLEQDLNNFFFELSRQQAIDKMFDQRQYEKQLQENLELCYYFGYFFVILRFLYDGKPKSRLNLADAHYLVIQELKNHFDKRSREQDTKSLESKL
jgi:hypothetical protein